MNLLTPTNVHGITTNPSQHSWLAKLCPLHSRAAIWSCLNCEHTVATTGTYFLPMMTWL